MPPLLLDDLSAADIQHLSKRVWPSRTQQMALPPFAMPPGFDETPIPRPTKLFLSDCVYHAPEEPIDALEAYVKFWLPMEKYGFVCYTDPDTQRSEQCFFHASGLLLHKIALYRDTDHEVVSLESEPNEKPLARSTTQGPGRESAVPSIPFHFSKGARLTIVLYPNEEKGKYAGRWYPSAMYEDLCSKAARLAEDRRRQILGLPKYTLALENALAPILDPNQWEQEDTHTTYTLTETNLIDRVAFVWQWATKILDACHQRLIVVEEKTDPITLNTETTVLHRWEEIRERWNRDKDFHQVGKFYVEAKDV